jgi:hypothetical protein
MKHGLLAANMPSERHPDSPDMSNWSWIEGLADYVDVAWSGASDRYKVEEGRPLLRDEIETPTTNAKSNAEDEPPRRRRRVAEEGSHRPR